ncbi:MAG: hypothetical protein JO250_24370 [Armatimonadetes bacterium]|nr:hypothetical protein [Armatimonadota bacterium]
MQGLLGKISKITPLEADPSRPALTRLQVAFKPACVLPQRAAVPEWLADQTLAVERAVADAREVGRPGDSLVLTADESARWLAPLVVTPPVSYGALPAALSLRLRWWKDEKPPEYTVRTNGRPQTGDFTKDGAEWTASVETAFLFDAPPFLPVSLEIACDKFTATCAVVPEDTPCHYRTTGADGALYHLENAWYGIDVTGAQGGGIRALRERGRGTDHFRRPADLIQLPLHHAGHADRLSRGWDDESLRDVVAASAGARREGGMTRLSLEATVDEGQNLRTTVAHCLYDDLPLLLIQRDFSVGKAKEDDKDKKPKEPIDAMQPLGLGFRAAWMSERGGVTGSRLLCADGDRLMVVRPVDMDEFHRYAHWRMAGGWGMVEHPGRREYALYLFDPHSPPHLATWSGAQTLTLEPFWRHRPVRPGEALGFVLALTVGELAGAGPGGAWVACRAPLPDGGVRCALVGRLPDGDGSATFTLGATAQEAAIQRAPLPGVGTVAYAVADFPDGALGEPFDAAAPGLPARRTP